ncbi:related to Diphthamide biosynthesis protein RRT2 [Saccharomycodes ludwigii]|uniref:methylated diphthine methylhydrolase n=1 Tax=Saccharomycodes ludwigii TaxID=36035 RepID=A0A376BAS8_9ASCO|nr:related to Diphthamide biosynthesis protein RRT2 [Saccharomycodes ludwigii]
MQEISDLREETIVEYQAKTEKPPCCLQILCNNKYILVGTYDLNKNTGFRNGSIDIYEYPGLTLLHKIPTYGAILDLKISSHGDRSIMITAHSTGNLMVWKINYDISSFNVTEMLTLQANYQVFHSDTLITSCHFSPLEPQLVLCTATNGKTKLLRIDKTPCESTTRIVQDEKITSINALSCDTLESQHSLECWIGEFGKISPLTNVVFTGGDDSKLIAHDLRMKNEIWSNEGRIHQAGVVSIKASSETFRVSAPTSLITGSYDDHIRGFDLRMLGKDQIYPGKMPVLNMFEKELHGGVWRLCESPKDMNRLLVCCMYNGAKIVEVESDKKTFEEMQYVKKGHDSMCYGGDWSSEFIATCSFYDNSLQVWHTL